ncbi:N-acetylneuraminate epimerase [Bisgaardia hudsonensis]|uniref:N-acetylneuraminate epimerase n=1 Tax=Bisgaardia hudsonensis TaxID=109472 RepID=A0A4R2N269_9PAST|nr:N-acetylneuraminate epimerase [Bisgaardia hudsonensis]QLB12414.1 N-acetylneuraminic acid mutarotase [Bisgaardia hudsonensis]TCP13941.1 N-acetylneuraminate epimerase [Bisgaardia hudsonensis]
MKKTALHTALFAAVAMTAFAAQAGQYPDLPVGIKGGSGALIGDTVYVGLGSGGDKFFSLNLKEKDAQWQELPAFPGGPRNQPVAAGVDGKLYVFGGFQKTEVANNQIINDVHVYNPEDNSWSKVDTRSPRTAVGASSVTKDGKIYFVGGVNEEIWNGLFQALTAAGDDKAKQKDILDPYFNMRAQDFFFSSEIASYEPMKNSWRNEGYFPYQGRAGAALGLKGDKLLVVNGEIKAGLRTPTTELGTIGKNGISWKKLGDLPAPEGYKQQEGIAGAMGGYTNGNYIVTGGANFPGARANYAKGIMDAHRTGGLKKTYHSAVYALDGKKGTWKVVGNFPQNIGYGVAVSYNNKVVVIGGETDGGKALTAVRTMSYDGKKLVIE